MTEFQEKEKPKKEKQVPKALLETTYKAFLNNKQTWRKELTFARDFPDARLNQLVIFLNEAISAGWPVFVVDETKGESEIGIIGIEHDGYYGIYGSLDLSKVQKSFNYSGPSKISLRHLESADITYILKRKSFKPKNGEFAKNLEKANSIICEVYCRGRLRRRLITDLARMGRPGKFWIFGYDLIQHQFFPVFGNSEGEWGIRKALRFQEF